MPKLTVTISAALLRRATDRAEAEGRDLDAVILDLLEHYAKGTDVPGMRVQGGYARAAALTAEQRREIARKAAEARWGKRGE